MKIAIYSRKSVYTGKGESIENQIEMCKKYIFEKIEGSKESDIIVYEDEGFSAKNTDRPQFQKLLHDIKNNNFNYIVCYRLDRISRNVSDFSGLIEELNKREISFVCIKEEFDTSKPMGKAMMYIASVFAQLERETIAERVRDNMVELSKTGRWLGGTVPTGFKSEKVQEIFIDGKIKTSCKLKFDPDEIGIVKKMYEKYLELHSVSGVSKYLIKNNIKSRTGKIYSLLGIKEILQNPVYCIADKDAFRYFTDKNAIVSFEEKDFSGTHGLISYNKRNYQKQGAPRQSIDKWIIAIGKHKGVVTGKEWGSVQNLLEEGKPTGKKPSKVHNDYSLLSGLIYCGKCGSRMFAKSRSVPSGLFDYICNSKMRGGTSLCGCQNISGQQVDDLTLEYLTDYTRESSDIFRLLENLKKELQNKNTENPLEEIRTRIEKCNEEMDNLIKTLSQKEQSTAFVERVDKRIGELSQEIVSLKEEEEVVQMESSILKGRETQIETIAGSLAMLKDNLESLTVVEKRALIKMLVQKLTWDGENLHIFIYGE